MICSILVLRYGTKVPVVCKQYIDRTIVGINFKGAVDYKLTWQSFSIIPTNKLINISNKYIVFEKHHDNPQILHNQTEQLVKEGIDRFILNGAYMYIDPKLIKSQS